MSKIGQLCGKPKTYNIGGVELQFSPRKLKDLDLLMNLSKEEKQTESMKELIRVTLKEADPEASEEEIENFSMSHFTDLTNAILDVNGLNKKDGLR